MGVIIKQVIMRNLILASLIICLSVFFFSSNTSAPDIIYWTEGHRLTWDDFEGTPRYDHDEISAITASGIVHYKGCKDGHINYKIQAYFEKNDSWVKAEALTDHHLKHEQIHFDITELYARRLRKSLSQRKFKCGEEMAFEQYINAFLSNWQSEQGNYDINKFFLSN